jgi:hypothetical protein
MRVLAVGAHPDDLKNTLRWNAGKIRTARTPCHHGGRDQWRSRFDDAVVHTENVVRVEFVDVAAPMISTPTISFTLTSYRHHRSSHHRGGGPLL